MLEMKIIIGEFRQETNSFNPVTEKWEDFLRCGIYEGKQMEEALKGEPCAVNGMFQAVEEAGGTFVPAVSMNGDSGGIVDQEVVDVFLAKTLAVLGREMPVDGVFLSLHGATQTVEWEDGCGEILSRIREKAGERAVIAASCDLHANVTELMWKSADFICGYHTYPHVDFYETGYRAARLGIQAIQGKKLAMVRSELPMIVPASSYTTLRGSFAELMEKGDWMVNQGRITDYSIFQMQPWLDVSCGGSAILTIGEEPKEAEECARCLAEQLWEIRHSFRSSLLSVSEICRIAQKNQSGKPVILVDSSDSTNAGACGDSAVVLREILAEGGNLKTAFYLNDPALVEDAFRAGVGAEKEFVVGGSVSGKRGLSATVTAVVRSLHDGRFHREGPAGKGMLCNVGTTAVLSVGAVDLVVCQAIAAPGDPQLYRHFGIEPGEYQLVVVKACTSYRASYEGMAAGIYEADTAGAAAVNLDKLMFRRLPKTFFPFTNRELGPVLCSINCD